jgi:hypothetical protein
MPTPVGKNGMQISKYLGSFFVRAPSRVPTLLWGRGLGPVSCGGGVLGPSCSPGENCPAFDDIYDMQNARRPPKMVKTSAKCIQFRRNSRLHAVLHSDNPDFRQKSRNFCTRKARFFETFLHTIRRVLSHPRRRVRIHAQSPGKISPLPHFCTRPALKTPLAVFLLIISGLAGVL